MEEIFDQEVSYESLIQDPRMEPFLIAFDRKSYIILERGVRERKDGVKFHIFRERCYPSSFKNALSYIVKQKVHSVSYNSLDDVLQAYKQLEEEFTAAIKF